MKDIDKIQHKVLDFVTFFTYFLYILVAFGLSATAPKYLDDLLFYTKIYVSGFLIYRFNPFRRIKFTSLDAKIGYNAGIFLLATTIINSVLVSYVDLFKEKVQSIIATIF
jgi:hypothetical protein